MRLQRILDGVTARLAARGSPAVDLRRVICLDDAQGPRRGCLLLLFGAGDTAPRFVAKAAPLPQARLREGRPVYEIEHANLEHLERLGLNDERRSTPEPLGLWRDGELLISMQSALRGELLKNLPGRRLFAPERTDSTVRPILEWWHRLQQRFGVRHTVLGASLYEQWVLAPVARFRLRFALDRDELEFLDRRFERQRRLLGLELPFMVEHGDFCPANIMREGDRIGVFDWEFPLRHRLPLFDVFHFFSSLRFPFRGWRGEATHFESFVEVYWGQSHVARTLRGALTEICTTYDIPREALGDLFVLALLRIANLKYEALLEIYGPPDTAVAPSDSRSRWRLAGGRSKDVPFAHIRDGVFENLRRVVREGLPPWLGD